MTHRPLALATGLMLLPGCLVSHTRIPAKERPSVAPAPEPRTGGVPLAPSRTRPLHRELLAIDLPTAARLVLARNPDIERARARVEGTRGRLESAEGALLPVLAPGLLFEWVDGGVRATEGNIVDVGFHSFTPFVAVQWVLNPGKVVYDLVAARKRFLSAQYEERAVVQEELKTAALQFYGLLLAQARVDAATQALAEGDESLRVARARRQAGLALPAEELRAEAEAAARRQDVTMEMQGFYEASVALALTLHLHPVVTLVPRAERLDPAPLVREDLPLDDLLALAVEHRDDLQAVRVLLEAAAAERSAAGWGALGPEAGAAYQVGGIMGRAQDVGSPPRDETFGLRDQERFTAGARWRLGLSSLGDLRQARSAERHVALEATRKLDEVRAGVALHWQESRAQRQLVGEAERQVGSAEEALRLARAHHAAGAMTSLDVLQAQTAAAEARSRHIHALVGYNRAQVALLAALGLLEARSLGAED